MKLWVDDIRIPPDDSWHICRSVYAAVRALEMFWPDVDQINLDHDISHQVTIGKMSRPYPCDETFAVVAMYMALIKKANPTWNPKITIQTSNPVGAELMENILMNAGFPMPERKKVGGANRLEMNL